MLNQPFSSPPTPERSPKADAEHTRTVAAFWVDNSQLPWLSSKTEVAFRDQIRREAAVDFYRQRREAYNG